MTEYCKQIMSFSDEVEEYNWKNLFSHLIKIFLMMINHLVEKFSNYMERWALLMN